MSDRCEKFVTMPAGSGYDDRCATCGVPCEEHPPLSPIALDWRGMVRMAEGLLPDGSPDPGALRPGVLDREYLRELVETWHRAEVARVAQEEREKARREFAAECRTRLVAHDPVGLKTGPLYDWLTKEME